MKRLRDIEPKSELQRKAQQLIGAVDPIPSSPERMARVRRRLDEPRGVWLAVRRLPAFAVAGLIALFGASAFAAVRVFVDAQAAKQIESAQQVERARVARGKAAQAVAAPQPQPRAPVVEPEPAAPEADVAAADEARSEQSAAPRAVPRHRHKAPARTAEQEQAEAAHDSELVHAAVKALRRDANPALAARLLEQDRVRNPDGPLAEEALSLRIEAAIALGDGRARTLAQQYVARYPSGRYLGIARRALGGETPK